jgi:hypothetical protein
MRLENRATSCRLAIWHRAYLDRVVWPDRPQTNVADQLVARVACDHESPLVRPLFGPGADFLGLRPLTRPPVLFALTRRFPMLTSTEQEPKHADDRASRASSRARCEGPSLRRPAIARGGRTACADGAPCQRSLSHCPACSSRGRFLTGFPHQSNLQSVGVLIKPGGGAHCHDGSSRRSTEGRPARVVLLAARRTISVCGRIGCRWR